MRTENESGFRYGEGGRVRMVLAGYSHKGRTREENQDAFWFHSGAGGALLLLADGMGGHAGGAVASRMAISRLKRRLCVLLQNSQRAVGPELDIASHFGSALESCNRWLREVGSSRDAIRGMGTTMVAALVRDGWLFVSHVGDSRAYLFRESQLRQLTADHTLAGQLGGPPGNSGKESGPLRHVLTQALGSDVELQPSFQQMPLQPGDQLLLCSDGLSGEVSELEINKVMESPETVSAKAQRLLQLALDRGGRDNITLILGSWPFKAGRNGTGSA